jgi:hypothetical protein
MSRYARLLLLCVFILAPATARADDGGFWDWLFRLDPKFAGVGSDFHAFCLDKNNRMMKGCEEFFMLRRLFGIHDTPIAYSEIRHEVSFRFAYYHTYGDLFASNPGDSAHAFKLMAMYAYHPDDHLTVGFGAGLMPFFSGDVESARWSTILTPVSVRYAPARDGNIFQKSFFLQIEASWITDPPTPDLFIHRASALPDLRRGEWNVSFSQGFDFRRRTLR